MTTNTPPLDPVLLRAQFPALQLEVNGETAVFLDGPGGTQSPKSVLDAMSGYLAYGSSNLGGPFLTSRHADAVVAEARQAPEVSPFIGCGHAPPPFPANHNPCGPLAPWISWRDCSPSAPWWGLSLPESGPRSKRGDMRSSGRPMTEDTR